MNLEEFATKQLLDAAGSVSSLTEREKHLIGLAVTATRGCIYCTGSRLQKAQQAAIPYETLVAAIDLAAAVNAGVTAAIAIQGAGLRNVEAPANSNCGCPVK